MDNFITMVTVVAKIFFTPIVYFEDGSEQNTSHHFALIIIFSETKNQKLF